MLGTWGRYVQQPELEHACDQSCSKMETGLSDLSKETLKLSRPKRREMAYQTLVHPQLEYAPAIYGPTLKRMPIRLKLSRDMQLVNQERLCQND